MPNCIITGQKGPLGPNTTGQEYQFKPRFYTKLSLTVKLPRLGVEAGLEVGGGGGEGLAEAVPGQGHQLGLHVGGAARHPAGADLQVDS